MKKQKRILFLSKTPGYIGGGEIFLVDLITELQNEYEIGCICEEESQLSNFLSDKIAFFHCDLYWSRKLKDYFSNLKNFSQAVTILKSWEPDLLYANSSHINPFAAKLAKKFSLPLITHVQDFFQVPEKDKYRFRESTHIITCSRAVKELVQGFNPEVDVIYYGVSCEKFHPFLKSDKSNLRYKLKLEKHFLIGNIGSLISKKGWLEFIEVARKIAAKIPESRFLIIGEIKEDKFVQELRRRVDKYGLNDKVIFTGFIKEVERAISALDILLFPTHKEALGRVIIEAFACKVLVITTLSGGPQEIVQDGIDGFLVPVGNIDSMVEKVWLLYRDEKLREFIVENAYRKFLSEFTIDKMVFRIKEIINRYI